MSKCAGYKPRRGTRPKTSGGGANMSALAGYRPRQMVGAFALAVMAAVAAGMRQPEQAMHVFRITLGVGDAESTDLSGRIALRDGDVTALTGWRFEDQDKVEGTSGWKCRTRN